MAAITLAAIFLRLPLLNRFPFHPDEAIYSFWGLHAWHDEPLFLTVWPDKPPLFLWLLSGTFQLLGEHEASARFLNVAISTLTVPVTAAIGRTLWNRRVALVAALALALNPYAISFGPTAFTDPLLVLAGMLALRFACGQHPAAFTRVALHNAFFAGLWLGVAIMTKQTGMLYPPLILAVLLQNRGQMRLKILAFLIGLGLVALPIIYWDSLRWAVAPSPWDLSVRNYGALQVKDMREWGERSREWGVLLWYLGGSWAVWVAVAVAVAARFLRKGLAQSEESSGNPLLLLGWSLAFVLLHIVTTVQPWDRYLLPLAPLWALGVGWTFAALLCVPNSRIATSFSLASAVLGVGLLLGPALQSARGLIPIGADHGAYSGLRDVVAHIKEAAQNSEQPLLIYHRALGWQYRFYLYHEVRSGAVELRWFPHELYLADNFRKSQYQNAYLAEPEWTALPRLESNFATHGLTAAAVEHKGEMPLFMIERAPQQACINCLCTEPNLAPVDSHFFAPLYGTIRAPAVRSNNATKVIILKH